MPAPRGLETPVSRKDFEELKDRVRHLEHPQVIVLTGAIVDGDGAPVPYSTVVATGEDGVSYTTTTNTEGRYRFDLSVEARRV